MRVFKNILLRIQKIPNKKKTIEFISAGLSIPVLSTVLLLNISNLKKGGVEVKDQTISDISKVTVIPVEVKLESQATTTSTKIISPTEKPKECKREIGSVELVSPRDDEVINDDHVDIDLSYDTDKYCPLQWSYRLDNDQWSEYTDKLVSLYNLSSGEKNLEIKVKNKFSEKEVVLKRKFSFYNNKISPTVVTPTVATGVTTTPTKSN